MGRVEVSFGGDHMGSKVERAKGDLAVGVAGK